MATTSSRMSARRLGHLEGVDQVGLAGVADLALVLEGREDVGPPEQLEVGVRGIGRGPSRRDPRTESCGGV